MGRWDNKVKHFDLDNFVIKSVKGEGEAMRLVDLDPKLTAHQLRFTCPACGAHRIVIPVGPEAQSVPPVWSAVGPVETLTVRPSIDATTPPCHWHGFITDGEVTS